jgi:hypothetical protein
MTGHYVRIVTQSDPTVALYTYRNLGAAQLPATGDAVTFREKDGARKSFVGTVTKVEWGFSLDYLEVTIQVNEPDWVVCAFAFTDRQEHRDPKKQPKTDPLEDDDDEAAELED